MKKIILSLALLLSIPVYLQAMFLADTPEELYKMYSSIPLHPIEEQLIKYEITQRSAQSLEEEIGNLPFPRFTVERIFHKDESISNSLVKNILDAIETTKNKPSDSLIPPRYLTLTTTYQPIEDNPSYIFVKTNFYNLEAIRTILSEYTEKK